MVQNRRLPMPEMSRKDIQRFHSYFAQHDNESCWLWQGAVNAAGYGKIGIGGRNGKTYYAHRVAYFLEYGAIPEEMVVDHLCRNTGCCNPKHLQAVEPRENSLRGVMPNVTLHHENKCVNGHDLGNPDNVRFVRESRKNGRSVKRCRICRDQSSQRYARSQGKREGWKPNGENSPFARLREEQVKAIRHERANGSTSKDIARRYGTTYQTVDRIVARKTWKHVE